VEDAFLLLKPELKTPNKMYFSNCLSFYMYKYMKEFSYTKPLPPSIHFAEESFVTLTANFYIYKELRSRKTLVEALKVNLYNDDLRAV
jgi:hypothetical protein